MNFVPRSAAIAAEPFRARRQSDADVAAQLLCAADLLIRARLGVAVTDRGLLYVTGGAAFADMQFSRQQNWSFADGCAVVGGLNSCHNGGTSRSVGWAVGGGGEYAITDHWTIKDEFLYANFGTLRFATNNSGPGFVGAPQTL